MVLPVNADDVAACLQQGTYYDKITRQCAPVRQHPLRPPKSLQRKLSSTNAYRPAPLAAQQARDKFVSGMRSKKR
jgi:hypothetical protein